MTDTDQSVNSQTSAGSQTSDASDASSPASWGEPRTKTVTFYDPLATARALQHLSGRQAIEAVRTGEVAPPPMASLLGFDITEVGDGSVTFTCTPDESAYNPIGVVHGGLMCTLLDSVIGCAVHTTLPAGVGYTSLEIKVNYLRAVHANRGALVARGQVTKPGRRVAFAEGQIHDTDGKLVATASGSCLIIGPASA
ncbi:MAG TPA: PaaI family thioesterase [Jatrophihabitans sp.]